MRRRLKVIFPIVTLALLVQFLAPIGAFRAVAQAASDPLYMATICSGMSSDQADPAPSQMPPAQHDCCAFCAGMLGGSAAIDPPVLFIILQREYREISWPEGTASVTPVRAGSNAQARAPPAFS